MRLERSYPVSPRGLLAVLTDEEFLRERGERYGGAGAPQVRRDGDRIVVTAPHQLPLDQVPGAFRRFAGDGRVVQIDAWAPAGDAVTGTWHVDAGRMPATVRGTHEIVATPEGCRHTVTADVKVNVPVIGGAIAGQVGDYLAELIREEQAFAAVWLARRQG